MDEIASIKCFVPQHLDDDVPDRKWGLDRLSELVRRQHDAIEQRERLLSPLYWELGQTLEVIRQEFAHGGWCKFLASLGITRSRASRARAIHRTHDGPEAVRNMTLDEASGKKDQARSPGKIKSVTKKRCSGQETSKTDSFAALLQEVCFRCDSLAEEKEQMDSSSQQNLVALMSLTQDRLARAAVELAN